MHDGKKKNTIRPNLINKPIWESLQVIASLVIQDQSPPSRVLDNFSDSLLNLSGEFIPKSRLFKIVIRHYLVKLKFSSFGECEF